MSSLISFNGSSYIIPSTNEVGWGSNVSSYLIAIAAGCLQKTGGSFTLSAETDFGATYGLKSAYYKTRGTSIASTGAFRLANAETGIVWRNVNDDGDLPLTVNSSDQLTFNGTPVSGSGLYTADRAIVSDGSGDLAAASTTSTEIGYVNGVTSAIQTQLDGKYSSSGGTISGVVSIEYTNAVIAGINIINDSTTADAAARINLVTTNASGGDPFVLLHSGASLTAFGMDVSDSSKFKIAMGASSLGSPNSFVLDTSGNLSILGALTAAATSNQLVLGATRTVTITAPTPASSSRTWTIPDLSGDMTFAALGGTQTFTGTKTFSNDITLASSKGTIYTDDSTHTVKVKATNSTTSYTLSLPTTAGSNNQYLTTDGSGNTSWTNSAGTGTVSSGTQYQLAYYATSTNTVSGLTLITASKALVSDANGLPTASSTTATELTYVSGVTSAIQTQLNAKATDSLVVHLAGTETITGSKTFSSAVAITPTTNQLILGTTRTVTLSASQPATSSRTYTMPDITADATFAYLEGTQTFSGAKTFTTAPTVSLATTGGTALTLATATGPQQAYIELAGVSTEATLALSSNRPYNNGSGGASNQTGQAAAWIILDSQNANGSIAFYTTASNNANPTQRITIDKNGLLSTGAITASGQANLNSTSGNPIHGTSTNDSAAAGYVGEVIQSYISSQTAFPTSGNFDDLTSIALTAGDWLITLIFRANSGSATTMTAFNFGTSTHSGNDSTGLSAANTSGPWNFATVGSGSNTIWNVSLPNIHVQLSGSATYYFKYSATYTGTAPVASGTITAVRIR